MIMTKKYYLLIILFTVSINFSFSQEKIKVVATASMIWDIAKNIAGDHLNVKCIVPIGGDPHIYEPTPNDARLVSGADLLLKNGLKFEGWIDELIDNSGTKATIVTVTEGLTPITSLQYHNSPDPHAWMNVNFAQVYIKNIRDAFIQLAPKHKEDFEKNYSTYKAQLEQLDTYIMEQIKLIPEARRILITSHDAFQYYGRRYGIRLEAIMGISTEAEAQTSDVIRLNKVIRESNVPAVFIETTINPKLIKQIARDNKVAIGGSLYADSIGDEGSPGSTYIKMLKHNTDVIVAALKKEKQATPGKETISASKNRYIIISLFALMFIGGFILILKKMN